MASASTSASGFRATPQRTFTVDDFVRSSTQVDEKEEAELTEQELRELYDSEEIERFLHLFSAYVTEVQAPDTSNAPPAQPNVDSAEGQDSDEEGLNLKEDKCTLPASPPVSISQAIVSRFVLPYLPPPRPASRPFTFGRLRLAIQRLYLAAFPAYVPFLRNMCNLATWEDPTTSSIYCTLYWTFWWYNLLAPALIGRLLFALLQRRLFSYPSLEELRRHRTEVKNADEFGAQVVKRLSATSSNNMTEVWRLMRMLDHTRKYRLKKLKEKAKEVKDRIASTEGQSEEDLTVLEDPDEAKEVQDLKQLGLFVLDEIVDVHERVQNIFIWRKPAASMKYAIVLFCLFILSFSPARYISKLVLFSIGFLFWHLIPLLAALSDADKRRIRPPFSDVPTDAEYAMQLVSERVEKGLDVTIKPTRRNKKKSQPTEDLPDGVRRSRSSSSSSLQSEELQKTNFFTKTSNTIGDIMKLTPGMMPGKGWPIPESWPPLHPLIPTALGIAQPEVNMDSHTYPCQHSSSPGLITLTPRAFFFGPLMSQNAKIVIPLSAVKGVKKTGLLKGLNIRWLDPSDSSKTQKEEKFHWIANRDELFARLIGYEGTKWQKV